MNDPHPYDAPDREAIAARAYELWLRRGCPHGSAEQDWLEAEAQLRREWLARAEAARVFDPEAAAGLAPIPAAEAPETPARRKRRSPVASATAATVTGTRVARKRPARPDA